MSTAATNPYYHTVNDTPDKVDMPFLVESTDAFDTALDHMFKMTTADYAVPDPELWTADVVTTLGANELDVIITVRDANGATRANAVVEAAAMYDDFMLTAEAKGTTDANGSVTLHLPLEAMTNGTGNRFLHVTGGPVYPLVEKIVPL